MVARKSGQNLGGREARKRKLRMPSVSVCMVPLARTFCGKEYGKES